MSTQHITVPDHVRAADVGPATVIVNYRTGNVEILIGPAARWWAELAITGNPDAPGALDAASARTLLGQLGAAGLIVPTRRPRPWSPPVAGPPWVPSWGTHELAAGRAEPVRAPLGVTMRAGLALAVVFGVLGGGRGRTRMARLTRLLTWAARCATDPASAEHARQAVHAVRRAGLLAPGRVACLEESAAVALLLAVSRQRVTWCHGVAADPVRLHAWVETDDGHPVAEPPSTLRFTALRTIPVRNLGDENDEREKGTDRVDSRGRCRTRPVLR
ncbi:lasso peptide biosynthesis B2 protein [Actinoalloteichus fjordicus]|uniref:Transglutaminase-like superfamily n=1 Tax=Actinoalloteichus fjordicus TaxID=1612552 RepID=A0AAC9LG14_9PSEU|nr:lasso peptide biosynthesis B2 protein [Actinoalloteichus fjordicus]APU15584.1 Transglutaminase-like superfamily [Actinoalloteichus fjordicus]